MTAPQVRVHVPPALRSYTTDGHVTAQGATLTELFADLDRQFPGLRFRVVDEQGELRRHMRLFVGGVGVRDMAHALKPGVEVAIVLALSGG